MAVSTSSSEAQAHVNQGLNHLHGGWEFEAARHFAAALKLDPECLLAHWGMAMVLLTPSPETDAARLATTERMLDLLNRNVGTDLERGYAYGLIKYIDEGPAGAAAAFRQVAKRFPNEMQAAVFAALFNRGGYDDLGQPTADQESAEKQLLDLIQQHPDSTVPINALLLIRAEAPDVSGSLDLARKLCQMAPDYAPYYHLLGHYEWRAGNHRRAASAFAKASTMFRTWMKTDNVPLANCPEWIRAEAYRVVALSSQGDDELALAAANQLAALAPTEGRPGSPGTRFLWWDAKTLPARVILRAKGLAGAAEALAALPPPDEVKKIRDLSLAYWWIDGLRLTLDGFRLIHLGKVDQAREVTNALTIHGEAMVKTQRAAASGGERTSWFRSFRALEVLASQLRGELAVAGPANLRAGAFNWFSSAADRQPYEPLLMPPLVLTPMATRLGDYQMASNKPAEAVEAYRRALVHFPGDTRSLTGLEKTLRAAGRDKEADETAAKLRAGAEDGP